MKDQQPSVGGLRARFPELWSQLREIADTLLHRHPLRDLTPSDLVQEGFLHLRQEELRRRDQGRSQLGDKPDLVFKACFGAACHDVLADQRRRQDRRKRGGDRRREDLNLAVPVAGLGVVDFVALHAALQRLQELDPRLQELVELRVHGDATVEECARHLGVSPSTIDREWRHALAWLRKELS